MPDLPYSRVYWTIVDDEKFATIYDSNDHLATWLRLLLIADQANPASAHVPVGTSARSLKALVACGLVDLSGGRYRIHGLRAERDRRAERGRNAANARWNADASDPAMQTHMPTDARRDETSLDKARQDELSNARGLPNLDTDAIHALEERTGRTWSQAGERQLSEYDRLIEDHGLTNVCVAMDALRNGKAMTARQLVWGAMKVLEPMLSPRVAAEAEHAEEVERNSRRGVEETQRYLRELRSVGAPPGDSA